MVSHMKSRLEKANATKPSEVQDVLDDLRHVLKMLRDASRISEQRFGISGAQLFVLQSLAQEPSLSINALAARTFTHQSSVSVVVAKLVKMRLVSRARSKEDARSVVLNVTKTGAALLQEAPAPAQQKLLEALHLLTPSHRKVLRLSLRALVEKMGLPASHPPMFFED